MKKILNKFIGFLCVAMLIMLTVAFAACGGPGKTEAEVVVSAKQTTIVLDVEQVEGYDYKSLFTVTSDGVEVVITDDMIESDVKAEAGDYTVTCEYQEKSASVAVTVTSSDAGWGDWEDVHNAKSTIKYHPEGTATYRFQAECTDLRGKGTPPGFSGTASTFYDMVVPIDGGDGACVTYLYTEGMTVNFIVVSDRDVDNASLSFRFGAEWMIVPISPEVFTIRVDRHVPDESLYSYDDPEHEGALGLWDMYFLDYYTDPADTDYYTIDEFECPEGTQIDGTDNSSPDSFETVLISTKLSLRQGVNCISLIINGADFVDETNHGIMECVAPCIDYMEITTEAQLGFFGQYDNGGYGEGLSIVE